MLAEDVWLLKAYHDHGLRETVDHAYNKSSFYQNKYHHVIDRFRSTGRLDLLPTLTKEELATAGADSLTSREFPRRFGFTSGTESCANPNKAVCLPIYQSQSEYVSRQEATAALMASSRELILNLTSNYHGVSFADYPFGVISTPLLSRANYTHIRQILMVWHRFDDLEHRVSSLSGSVGQIKLLTALLLRDGVDPARDLQVRQIDTRSSHLTSLWREYLTNTYIAKVTNIYGFSEIGDSAMVKCTECARFHPPRNLIIEVLERDLDQRIQSNTAGELVITSLPPNNILQPMIRYRTGDLVMGTYQHCSRGSFGLILLGRIRKAVWSHDGQLVVAPLLLYEAMDSCASINTEPNPEFQIYQLGKPYGAPRYQYHWHDNVSRTELQIKAETSFNPYVYKRAAERAKEEIHHHWRQAMQIHRLLPPQGVKIELLPPGALNEEAYESM